MKILLSIFTITVCCVFNLGLIETLKSVPLNDHHNVKVIIKGIKSEKGKLVLAIFKDQEGFKSKKPIKRLELNKSDLEEIEVVLKLDLGTYGISVLDDENSNNKMDYNFIGIPKEGFGFSNYYHEGLSKPHFDRFKFEINNRAVELIDIRLRYM
jgi:uncharacterized protein (DUF2141 family)